jgi:hypothetical protein
MDLISISPLTRTKRRRVNGDIVDRHQEPARSDSLVDSGGDKAEYELIES